VNILESNRAVGHSFNGGAPLSGERAGASDFRNFAAFINRFEGLLERQTAAAHLHFDFQWLAYYKTMEGTKSE
jgi:hypothetical protein